MSVTFENTNSEANKSFIRFNSLSRVTQAALEVMHENWPLEYVIYAAVRIMKKACQIPMESVDRKSFSIFNPPNLIEASLMIEGLEKKTIVATNPAMTIAALRKVMMQSGPLLFTRFTNRPLDYLADETAVAFDASRLTEITSHSFYAGSRLFVVKPITGRVEEKFLLDLLRVCRIRPVTVWALKRFYF